MIPAVARIEQGIRSAWESWGITTGLGIGTSSIVWIVWYFTKIPCLPDNAAKGLCNPDLLASLINAETLALAGGAGLAVATLKGGYDQYMMRNLVNQEREARQKTEQELRELVAELRDELREERRLAAEDRRRYEEQQREDRQRFSEDRQRFSEDRQRFSEQQNQLVAMQQAMLETIVQLAQDRNGNHRSD